MIGVMLLMGKAGAEPAKLDLAAAAHLTAEQKLEGQIHDQVVYARKGLAIWDQIIEDNDLTLHYPRLHIANHSAAASRINESFHKRAIKSQEAYNRANSGEIPLTSRVNYLLSYHGDQYLSFREYGYSYYERAAHPTSWELGATFDMGTGRIISWQDVLKAEGKSPYTVEQINHKLFASPYKDVFYSDFKGLTKLPENYYLDEKGSVHFVFQEYEVAPYAAGIIDLPMEKSNSAS